MFKLLMRYIFSLVQQNSNATDYQELILGETLSLKYSPAYKIILLQALQACFDKLGLQELK